MSNFFRAQSCAPPVAAPALRVRYRIEWNDFDDSETSPKFRWLTGLQAETESEAASMVHRGYTCFRRVRIVKVTEEVVRQFENGKEKR